MNFTPTTPMSPEVSSPLTSPHSNNGCRKTRWNPIQHKYSCETCISPNEINKYMTLEQLRDQLHLTCGNAIKLCDVSEFRKFIRYMAQEHFTEDEIKDIMHYSIFPSSQDILIKDLTKKVEDLTSKVDHLTEQLGLLIKATDVKK